MVHPPSARSDSTGTVGSTSFWPRLPSRSGIAAAATTGAAAAGTEDTGAASTGAAGAALGAVSDVAAASLPVNVSDESDRPVIAAPSVATPSTAATAIASTVRRRWSIGGNSSSTSGALGADSVSRKVVTGAQASEREGDQRSTATATASARPRPMAVIVTSPTTRVACGCTTSAPSRSGPCRSS